jgi:hypothetical protein
MKIAAHTLLKPTARAHSATVLVVPRSASTALHSDPDATSVVLAQPAPLSGVIVTGDDRLHPNSVHTP